MITGRGPCVVPAFFMPVPPAFQPLSRDVADCGAAWRIRTCLIDGIYEWKTGNNLFFWNVFVIFVLFRQCLRRSMKLCNTCRIIYSDILEQADNERKNIS